MTYGVNLSVGTMGVWSPSLEIGRSNDYVAEKLVKP